MHIAEASRILQMLMIGGLPREDKHLTSSRTRVQGKQPKVAAALRWGWAGLVWAGLRVPPHYEASTCVEQRLTPPAEVPTILPPRRLPVTHAPSKLKHHPERATDSYLPSTLPCLTSHIPSVHLSLSLPLNSPFAHPSPGSGPSPSCSSSLSLCATSSFAPYPSSSHAGRPTSSATSTAMGAWNIFRILGDLSHMLSKCILIFAIHRNRSAEGVSLITQILYAVVFCTRYLDIFREWSGWNLTFKIFYILSSFYILGVMQWIYPRSREREIAWKMGAGILAGCLALSPFVMMIFEKFWGFMPWMWVFSEILESVCVLPQLLLLRQTTVPTVIDSFYLVTLGSYRALYCLNWFLRELDSTDRKPNAVSVIFGLIQTALYIDFAWVYYTRQRVKLRGGGVVDADDMSRGWLLRRIFGKRFQAADHEDDEESGPALGGDGNNRGSGRPKWGSRGISVSADEGVLETDRLNAESADLDGAVDPDAKMQDPDELARALDDDDDDAAARPSSHKNVQPPPNGIRNGDEWDD
ncbi:LOW QUALITY PROTEIN: ER lumen protein-retaining receptor [Paramyrothecium foliicola]|nr:LOW QUALITY PROTEIN: ER lumen protein-retaining receptor [Paramyrothecium foliicola]